MVKLVVADDEERVCRLILALGEWEKLGIEVAGTAANGIQALEMIRREKIDILITDIRMPGCSGMELIEKARKFSPDIKIMIISGYANFEYAQTALKQSVRDYLLKPIDRAALNESLAKMVREIEMERRKNLAFQDIQNERKEEMAKIRNMLVYDLVHERSISLTEESLRDRYYFNVHSGVFQVIAVKRDVKDDSLPYEEELVWSKMKEILLREVTKECYDLVVVPMGEYLYGVLNYPLRNSEKIRKALRSSMNQMLGRNDYLGQSQISMGLGSAVKRPEEITASFLIAGHALGERLLEGTGKILDLDTDTEVLFERKLVDKFARRIGTALQTLNIEEIQNAVHGVCREAAEAQGVHGWEILALVCQCGSMFIMRMDFPNKGELSSEFARNCQNCTTVRDLFEYLLDFMLEKINHMISQREEDAVRPVRLAKQFIHNHYQEQITLEEVSEYVGLTPAYFSVMFKKETEIGFAKYLISERIEGAKELLRETSLSVSEICRKVGYNDPKHFTRLFEKNVGVKPAVYRKLYG